MMTMMSLLSAGMCKRLVCYASCVFFVASLATLVPSYFRSCQLTSTRFLTTKSVTKDRGLRGSEGDMFLWNVGNHYPAMQHHIPGDYNPQLHLSENLKTCTNRWSYIP
jgi:hypothetical protein